MTRRQTMKASTPALAISVAGWAAKLGLAETAGQASGQSPTSEAAPIKRTKLLEQGLPEMEGKQVTVVTVEYAPGAGSERHRHPGSVVGYVLEGSLLIQVEPGPVVTYTQGQIFYEPPMHVHAVSRNASDTRPAKLLAFLITEKGQPLTLPAS